MRQVAILATLLVAALIGSYLAWTADEADTSKTDTVVVYRASADEIERISWSHEGSTTVAERRTDARGAYVWVTITEPVAAAEPIPEEPADEDDVEGPDDAPPAVEPEPATPASTEVRTVSFKGNEAADKLWEEFAPLHALRELVADQTITDAAFGFDTPSGTLEIQRRSGPVTLILGGETYGAKDRYAKLDSRIFLLDDKTLRPLQYAKTRLVDRLLQPIEERSADRIDVAWEGRTASFVHKNKDDRAAAFWASAESPATEDAATATWVGKLMRMRVQDYDVPVEASALSPVFRFTVSSGKESWGVDVLLHNDTNGVQYYARTDFARGLVHLTESLASEAAADLDTVFPAE